MADLTGSEPVVVAKGGRGGWGNSHFATPTRQIPKFAKPGLPAEDMHLKLELKVIADVGLIGFPNVGKSTLISIISAARPKIANYHFTTLTPVLGVVRVGPEQSFVCADIPGLIEGAADGVGLGHDFLRHVERCRLLLHVVDVSGCEGRDPKADFEQINHELAGFSAELADRPQIVLGNKCDIATPEQVEEFKQYIEAKGLTFLPISGRNAAGGGRPARAGLQPPEESASGQGLRGRVQAPRQERPAHAALHRHPHRQSTSSPSMRRGWSAFWLVPTSRTTRACSISRRSWVIPAFWTSWSRRTWKRTTPSRSVSTSLITCTKQ